MVENVGSDTSGVQAGPPEGVVVDPGVIPQLFDDPVGLPGGFRSRVFVHKLVVVGVAV